MRTPYAYGRSLAHPYAYAGYGYGYPGYGYSLAAGAYGEIRIQGAPKDAHVYVDGYYAGIVDDFDGTFQRLNVEPDRIRSRSSCRARRQLPST